MKETRSVVAGTAFAPVIIAYSMLVYAITSPMNHSDVGDPYIYPLYTDFWLQVSFLLGSWLWLTVITWLFEYTCHQQFNMTYYNQISDMSNFAYISHFFFILLITLGIVRPNKLSFTSGVFFTFVGSLLLI
jgi:hypothetical protein